MPAPPKPSDTLAATPTDEELDARAFGGEASAFDELVQRHQGNLLAFCRSRVKYKPGAQQAAEDAVQNVFVQAFLHRGRFAKQESGSFRRWLYAVAFRESMNVHRQHSRRRETYTTAEMTDQDTAELLEIMSQRWQALNECIEKLPPRQRCVVRATLEGHKTGPASEHCGCTPAQASSAKHDAIRQLTACTERKGV